MSNSAYRKYYLPIVCLLLCILVVILVSCLSISVTSESDEEYGDVQDYQQVDTTEHAISVLNRLLEENPIKGLVLLQKFSRSGILDEKEFTLFKTNLTESIKKIMRQHYIGENYLRALHYLDVYTTYHNFMDKSDNTIPLVLDRKELLSQIINTTHEKEQYPIAQKFALELFTMNQEFFLDSQLTSIIYEEFHKYQNIVLYDLLCVDTIMSRQEDTCPQKIDNSTIPINDLLASTFVIDIDKGITAAGLEREIGSAFFITRDGYALTNYHVIQTSVDSEYEGKSEITVKLEKDNFLSSDADIEIIGYDPLIDLALIKVEEQVLEQVFSLSRTSNLVPGERITVIGSPIGLANTVTSGIISSTEREGFTEVGTVIQMDASVNPGNSGGPMLDQDNNVVGVVVAKILGVDDINFAIPNMIVNKILPRLFLGNQVSHSWIGVGGYLTEKGLEVLYVVPNSGASIAGIEVGDILVSIDNKSITNIAHTQMDRLGVAEDILVEVSIIKKEEIPSTTTKSLLVNTTKRDSEVMSNHVSMATFHQIFPMLSGTQIELTSYSHLRPQYRITKVFRDSPAAFVGFTEGDIIKLRRIHYQKELNIVAVEIRVLQQSRGFLEDVFTITFPLVSKNFL